MLHLLQHRLVNLQCLLQLVRLLVSFYHSRVNDGVHKDAVFFHVLKDFTRAPYVVVLYTGLKEAAIGHRAWHQSCTLHLAKDFECVFELVLLTVGLDYDSIRHSTGLDWGREVVAASFSIVCIFLREALIRLTVHLIEKLDCSC